MRDKRIITLLSTLLLLMMVVSPVFPTIAVGQTREPASIGSNESLIVRVYEDESVSSNNPDANYDSNTANGGVWVGYEPIDGYVRAWLKYDLSSIPKEIGILSVSINLYCNDEFATTTDLPVGIYYSDNDTWSETSITWNNQPSFDAFAADVIDSPASPNMFVPLSWYSWDVTVPFTASLENDKKLTLVLKQIDEAATNTTWKYFVEKDYDVFIASYLSVDYTTPDTVSFTVDGRSAAPLINYIQDSTPDLGWTMADSGTGEFQRDYALEVNSNQYFNGTTLWQENHTDPVTILESSGSIDTKPFWVATECRYQMKFNHTMLSTSGVVDKLCFAAVESIGTLVFENLLILMMNTDDAGALTSDFEANYGSGMPIMVLNRSSYSTKIVNNFLSIDIENTFFLNSRQSLIIELRFTNNTGTLVRTLVTTDIGGTVAYTTGAGAYTATTATYLYTRAHSLKVEITSDEAYSTPGASLNHFPFDTDNGYPGVFQLKYNKTLIGKTGFIDRIYFPVDQSAGDVVFEGLKAYLVETPVVGALSHTSFADNYGDVTPNLVLDEDVYHIRNLGGVLVLDVDNSFYYHGDHDFLIELRWDSKVSGSCSGFTLGDTGTYRAYNLTWWSEISNANDTVCYDMILDFVHSENPVVYAGAPLVNATTYYWRVKICDSTGIWSDWTSSSFKYEKLTSTPAFEGPIASPSPAYVGSPVTVSLEVTYFLGISEVWIELSGTNHSMVAMADIYSYTWTPDSAGNVTYTIYMESNIGTWSSVDGFLIVLQSGFIIDPIMLMAIAGVVLVVVIVLVVILRGRAKK